MTTEEYIKAAAERNWSKTQTREALGMCREKFWLILKTMPQLDWAGPGRSHGHRLDQESRRGLSTPKVEAALSIARRRRYELHTHEVNGVRGTIEELAEKSQVSASTVRRRLKSGMSLERALTAPCTPCGQRRTSVSAIAYGSSAK